MRELIKRASLTQTDLARELGVDPGTLSRYLAGQRVPPSFEFVTKLVELVVARIPDSNPPFANFGALRESYFFALQAKDPVRAYQYMLENQLNQMEEQVRLGEGQIKTLTEELQAERSVRAQLELRISELDAHAPEDRAELTALTQQLEEALSHASELEELLDQTHQALKLAQQDRQRVEARMVQSTTPVLFDEESRKLIDWARRNDAASGSETIDAIAYQVAEHLITLRFDERNEEVDELRRSLVSESHPCVVFATLVRLDALSRSKETNRLLRVAGSLSTVRKIVELIHLIEDDAAFDYGSLLEAVTQRDFVTVARVIVGLDDISKNKIVHTLSERLSGDRLAGVLHALEARHYKLMSDGTLEEDI
ncbi:helix-turn-helix domain-containing protein [Streptomyces tauricus]|uniref:helix-turn-helix domain-containing protein n=1 Tax=Streptomyces tauricus TaxID=68274 RepID=UPI002242C8C7|nr:helix-turn-helix domain-containing protein [Streptomyces tauricus]MCW8102697.1 helix-turn-helix domain-containing protein [Streptomyces tauricus]